MQSITTESESRALKDQQSRLDAEYSEKHHRKKTVDAQNKECELLLKKLQKDITATEQHRKKSDQEVVKITSDIQRRKQVVDGMKKEIEKLRSDAVKHEQTLTNLKEEQQIFVGQLVKKGLDDKQLQSSITAMRKEIQNSEEQAKIFQDQADKWLEEIKFLGTIREKMARTAS